MLAQITRIEDFKKEMESTVNTTIQVVAQQNELVKILENCAQKEYFEQFIKDFKESIDENQKGLDKMKARIDSGNNFLNGYNDLSEEQKKVFDSLLIELFDVIGLFPKGNA